MHLILFKAPDMIAILGYENMYVLGKVTCQLHAPAALPPGKETLVLVR
jgi:hypothetical protein